MCFVFVKGGKVDGNRLPKVRKSTATDITLTTKGRTSESRDWVKGKPIKGQAGAEIGPREWGHSARKCRDDEAGNPTGRRSITGGDINDGDGFCVRDHTEP